jgi:hypothetical protein
VINKKTYEIWEIFGNISQEIKKRKESFPLTSIQIIKRYNWKVKEVCQK